MESLSQTVAESPPPPADPGPSVQDSRVDYIQKKPLPMLRDTINDLLQRYQDAGIR
jgi:hypothetical protein